MIWCLLLSCVPLLSSAFHVGNRQNEIEGEGELYLAINALAFIDDDGNTIKRRLEVDFFGTQVNFVFKNFCAKLKFCRLMIMI